MFGENIRSQEVVYIYLQGLFPRNAPSIMAHQHTDPRDHSKYPFERRITSKHHPCFGGSARPGRSFEESQTRI